MDCQVGCRGQLDSARLATEQLEFELGFERAKLLAERRLLDVEPRCRASHMTFLRDGNEISEMAQFHTHDVSLTALSYIRQTPGHRLFLIHGERSKTPDRAIPEMGRRAAAQLCRVARCLEQHLPAQLRLGRRGRRRSHRARRRGLSGTDGARPGEAGRSGMY